MSTLHYIVSAFKNECVDVVRGFFADKPYLNGKLLTEEFAKLMEVEETEPKPVVHSIPLTPAIKQKLGLDVVPKSTSLVATAAMVLKKEGRLTIREIWEIIESNGLYLSTGKTPQATLASQIYMEYKNRGKASRFQPHKRDGKTYWEYNG